MNAEEISAINALVTKMDDVRCMIQRGEAVEVEGGIQQVIYDGEVAINRLMKIISDTEHSKKTYEDMYREYKRDYETVKAKESQQEEIIERYGKMIDHLLDE
ncbi:MAG TPA: hypothetical protein PL124_08760 [Candidatus Cloacimonadota bacterium]|nr:hypothetical protein [Candidatus Cloacimonadota bacterium]